MLFLLVICREVSCLAVDLFSLTFHSVPRVCVNVRYNENLSAVCFFVVVFLDAFTVLVICLS